MGIHEMTLDLDKETVDLAIKTIEKIYEPLTGEVFGETTYEGVAQLIGQIEGDPGTIRRLQDIAREGSDHGATQPVRDIYERFREIHESL